VKIPSAFQSEPQSAYIGRDLTPVEIFQRVYALDQYAFLYESMENEKQRGRYSIVGGRPGILFSARGKKCRITTDERVGEISGDPFSLLKEMLKSGRSHTMQTLFCGGAVGYIAYDAVRHIETISDANPEDPELPELLFIFPTEIILCDHQQGNICVLCYRNNRRLEELVTILEDHVPQTESGPSRQRIIMNGETIDRDRFCQGVEQAKEYIRNGDIFQVVLSHRYKVPVQAEPLTIYKNLRLTNPSPYMYFLNLNNLAVLGSSPETLIKLQDHQVISVPIAGTRPRGKSAEEDQQIAHELLNDEKERAEHIMLVDLARNDIGRVSAYGSVMVTELMKVEKYSKVMHLTSRVTGDLVPGLNAFDVFKASFPAGTVSGAPKVRAMEIIDELETVRRGIYAGAIGYFGFEGNMDFCIAIRTIIIHEGIAFIQGGAGIVADSIPEREYYETLHKMEALKRALEIAP